jgi:GGDEF domain-containing protein
MGGRIRRTVEAKAPHQVSVSVGATWQHPMDGGGLDEVEQVWALVDKADELMDAAKHRGRHRVHISTAA